MTTLRQLIKNLEKLVEKEPGIAELEVFTIHGASGCSNEIGSVSVQTKKGRAFDEGPTCDLPEGTRFIQLYTGN
jgi:hypothetical protein